MSLLSKSPYPISKALINSQIDLSLKLPESTRKIYINPCSICLCEFSTEALCGPCGHLFHNNCFEELINKSGNCCPVCRKSF